MKRNHTYNEACKKFGEDLYLSHFEPLVDLLLENGDVAYFIEKSRETMTGYALNEIFMYAHHLANEILAENRENEEAETRKKEAEARLARCVKAWNRGGRWSISGRQMLQAMAEALGASYETVWSREKSRNIAHQFVYSNGEVLYSFKKQGDLWTAAKEELGLTI